MGEPREQVLEDTNHVTKEANTYHFDYDLNAVFIRLLACDVSIAHRWEGDDDPIEGSNVEFSEVVSVWDQLAFFIIINPPSIFMFNHLIESNHNPYVGE